MVKPAENPQIARSDTCLPAAADRVDRFRATGIPVNCRTSYHDRGRNAGLLPWLTRGHGCLSQPMDRTLRRVPSGNFTGPDVDTVNRAVEHGFGRAGLGFC